MGLLDKVKAQATVLADKAQTGMQQGQTKIQEMQAGKQADHLLRELGAYVFVRLYDDLWRARDRRWNREVLGPHSLSDGAWLDGMGEG